MIDRQDVLDAARTYWKQKVLPSYVPGETYVPVSGKIMTAEDLVHLIDSSLDMWLTAGRFAKEFESKLAKRTGLRHALATVSGSSANLLAFTALTSPELGDKRILPGSEVITVAAGFPTTVNPIVQNQCVPVFVDVDVETHNIDISQLEAALTDKTRAVMVAHTLGNPFDVVAVKEFCTQHKLYLIEDCCDALGATVGGTPVGHFGSLATLSFYPAHHITTGEGGAVLTNRNNLAKIVESFRDWGRSCWCPGGEDNTCGKRFGHRFGTLPAGYDHKYTYSHIGYNMKLTDMQAAIGVSQLDKVDQFIELRRRNHRLLVEGFRKAGLEEFFILPQATKGTEPSWFGFALSVRADSGIERNLLVETLEKRRIGTRIIFAGNLARQPAYEGVNFRSIGDLPNTDFVMSNSFWLGCWPGIELSMIEYMIATIADVVKELRA